jgi:toxin CcdB
MSRQFDVVRNPDDEDAPYRPYLVILQSDLISELNSTIVAPLVPHHELRGAPRLNPVVRVDESEYWLATHELFAVSRRELGKPVASLGGERDAIMAALDFVFIGF